MFQGKTSTIFLFYCGTVSRKTDEKCWDFFCFLAQKMKLAVVSYMKLTEIMKPSKFGQEKKLKLTAAAKPRAVSFNFFFLTEFGGFIISCQFHV